MSKVYYCTISEIQGYCKGFFKCSEDEYSSLIVFDTVFYYNYISEEFIRSNIFFVMRFYPDTSVSAYKETVCSAVRNYIRSLFPESMRGGILS